jgi:GntR family transcriptional regulator
VPAVPLYYQIFTVLRQRIADGTYEPGQQLPPEDELAQQWKVSRGTMRQALQQLAETGLVKRQQGRGSFVQSVEFEPTSPMLHGSIDDLIAATYLTRMGKVTVDREQPIPGRIAEQLQLASPVGTIVRRTRLDTKGNAFGVLVNYLSDEYGTKLSVSALRKATLIEMLEAEGAELARAVQSIRAGVADVDVADELGIMAGEPVLAVERVIYEASGSPVELLRSWYRSDLYDYRVIYERGGS